MDDDLTEWPLDCDQVHHRVPEGAQRGGRPVEDQRDPGGVEAVLPVQRRVHPPHAGSSGWVHRSSGH